DQAQATAEQDKARHTTVTLTADLDAYGTALGKAAQQLGLFATFAQQLRPIDIGVRGGDKVTGTAAALQTTIGGMEAVLGLFKTMDDLNQRQKQDGSIAENLVGKPGQWAEIDELLKHGVVSQGEYDAAVQAGYRIQQRSASVEQDLASIRAK